MKKILAMLLLLCLCLSLTACGVSMDKFEDNLSDDYDIESIDDDDLEEYAELLDLDMDDYEIEDAIEATHEKTGKGVMIIECGSKKAAEELGDDAEGMVKLLKAYYGSGYSFDLVVEGKFVLIGEEDAIEDALGK